MALVPIKNLGKGGVVKDTEPALLPENVMTDALNVRFKNGSIEKILGESVLFSTVGVSPEYGIHWRRPDTSYNVLIKDGKAYAKTALGVETEMLDDPSYTDSKWQMGSFGGGYAIFINDGFTTPRYALYGDASADLTFQPFPGWDYIVGTTITARVLRSFGYSLVAANLTFDDGVTTPVEAPVTVRISNQAVIGGFPSIWQPGLTTDTADEFEIDAESAILDMRELRGNMMIYTSNSIHMLNISNGFTQVRPYATGHGVLAQGCVAEFDGNHFVVDANDIYIHNGSGQTQSVAEGIVKEFFFEDLNPLYSENVFVVKNSRFREMWVCYPDLDSTGLCNKAMIFNYVDKTWTFRTLPGCTDIFVSPIISGGSFRYSNGSTLVACGGYPRVLLMDDTYQMISFATGAAADFSSYVTREKLFSGDPFGENTITGMTPVLKCSVSGDVINITITSQNIYDKAADFSNTSGRDTYTISPQSESQGYKIEPRQVGRFINYEIESTDYWKLSFIGLDLKPAGRR